MIDGVDCIRQCIAAPWNDRTANRRNEETTITSTTHWTQQVKVRKRRGGNQPRRAEFKLDSQHLNSRRTSRTEANYGLKLGVGGRRRRTGARCRVRPRSRGCLHGASGRATRLDRAAMRRHGGLRSAAVRRSGAQYRRQNGAGATRIRWRL
jgi:hypothetical protein